MAQKRKNWNGLISGFKASDLVFLNESGCNTDMTRRYAYSLRGSRAIDLFKLILKNILTALYEPFGFALLLSFFAMFF